MVLMQVILLCPPRFKIIITDGEIVRVNYLNSNIALKDLLSNFSIETQLQNVININIDYENEIITILV